MMATVDTEPTIDTPSAPPAPPLTPVAPPLEQRGPSTLLIIMTAFLAGLLVAGGAAALWFGWGVRQKVPVLVGDRSAPSPAPALTLRPVPSADPVRQQAMAGRIDDMEARLARIALEAEAASGKAVRAEHLLIAFAARRALDSGQPLGYVEGQLRLRFGQSQPRAVATIINAAREPVTLADLQGSLEGLAPNLVASGPDAGWWQAIRQELGGLVTFRRAGSPSPAPQQRLDRIRRYLAGGRVDVALAEVSRMPGRAATEGWTQLARRYLEAHRALDVIEQAAILQTHELRQDIAPAGASLTEDGGDAVEASSANNSISSSLAP